MLTGILVACNLTLLPAGLVLAFLLTHKLKKIANYCRMKPILPGRDRMITVDQGPYSYESLNLAVSTARQSGLKTVLLTENNMEWNFMLTDWNLIQAETLKYPLIVEGMQYGLENFERIKPFALIKGLWKGTPADRPTHVSQNQMPADRCILLHVTWLRKFLSQNEKQTHKNYLSLMHEIGNVAAQSAIVTQRWKKQQTTQTHPQPIASPNPAFQNLGPVACWYLLLSLNLVIPALDLLSWQKLDLLSHEGLQLILTLNCSLAVLIAMLHIGAGLGNLYLRRFNRLGSKKPFLNSSVPGKFNLSFFRRPL